MLVPLSYALLSQTTVKSAACIFVDLSNEPAGGLWDELDAWDSCLRWSITNQTPSNIL